MKIGFGWLCPFEAQAEDSTVEAGRDLEGAVIKGNDW